MLQKRKGFLMLLLLTATGCLWGCAKPNPPANPATPSPEPAISKAATVTPTQTPTFTPAAKATEAPVPTETATPTPTATGTPTPTPSPTATPTPTPSPTPTPTPTPIPTVPPAPVAINTNTNTLDFIINRDYPLTETYVPTDLVEPDVPFSFNYKDEKRKLRKVAAEALEDLFSAAKSEKGLTIYAVSGYRSYERQYEIYGGHLAEGRSIQSTNLYSAAPGNSEHQTGLAMDVSCKSIGYALKDNFATTPEGIWLKENCWRFGFILRYQKDKEHITGYAYEPWHIRYVGIPLAYYLYNNNLTLEEYYGTSSSRSLEELANTPLIDMNTDKFYNLYAKTHSSELLYNADGTVWVSETTGLPHIKALIRDAADNIIKVNGSGFFIEPIFDLNGNYVFGPDGSLCYTKPYFDAEGSLWLDYNGAPVYLQPLWNADGTLARDAAGNIIYTEPMMDLSGMEVITETGGLVPKVPIRDIHGELVFRDDGTVCFYEPYVFDGEYIFDTATGLPLYPSDYYDVPHNTLPLPKEEPAEEGPFIGPEVIFPEENFPEEPFPEDSTNDTTDETGGFFG